MADPITRRGNSTRNSNQYAIIKASVRQGEKPLNRAERRAAAREQKKGGKNP
jgi:hypothetical protein